MEPDQLRKNRNAELNVLKDETEGRVPDLAGHCEDILEIAGLISTSLNQETIISDAVNHLARRLSKRARCAILEGDELVLRYWSGHYESPLEGAAISRQSVVWKIFEDGEPVNLTDERQSNGYMHTLKQAVKVKAVVPFGYLDPVTHQQRNMGALIVDSGESGLPVSEQEFEYLKIIGHLIGSVAGRVHLFDRFTDSCLAQQQIIRETAHNFRNRMVVIGGLCRRILKHTADRNLGNDVSLLYEEVKALEAHVERFEKYMNDTLSH